MFMVLKGVSEYAMLESSRHRHIVITLVEIITGRSRSLSLAWWAVAFNGEADIEIPIVIINYDPISVEFFSIFNGVQR